MVFRVKKAATLLSPILGSGQILSHKLENKRIWALVEWVVLAESLETEE
jgi:hypothetical protein